MFTDILKKKKCLDSSRCNQHKETVIAFPEKNNRDFVIQKI